MGVVGRISRAGGRVLVGSWDAVGLEWVGGLSGLEFWMEYRLLCPCGPVEESRLLNQRQCGSGGDELSVG